MIHQEQENVEFLRTQLQVLAPQAYGFLADVDREIAGLEYVLQGMAFGRMSPRLSTEDFRKEFV